MFCLNKQKKECETFADLIPEFIVISIEIIIFAILIIAMNWVKISLRKSNSFKFLLKTKSNVHYLYSLLSMMSNARAFGARWRARAPSTSILPSLSTCSST
jgi:hypothetical protein